MVVDRVIAALAHNVHGEDSEVSSPDDNIGEEEDEDDEEMSAKHDEIDDLMTLDQYQEVQRRDSLIRKNVTAPNNSHKKGRVDGGGSRSS